VTLADFVTTGEGTAVGARITAASMPPESEAEAGGGEQLEAGTDSLGMTLAGKGTAVGAGTVAAAAEREDDDDGKSSEPSGKVKAQRGPQHHEQDCMSLEDLLASEDIDWEIDEPGEPPSRARSKYDLWHQFHDLPMAKTCPKRVAVFELMIHASWVFVEDDFDKVADFLVCKGTDPEELYEHFYFNRKWWKE